MDPVKKTPKLELRGVDDKADPYQVFKSIEVKLPGNEKLKSEKDPATFATKDKLDKGKATIRFGFHGHYAEPSFEIDIDLDRIMWDKPNYYLMEYKPSVGKWTNFEEHHFA